MNPEIQPYLDLIGDAALVCAGGYIGYIAEALQMKILDNWILKPITQNESSETTALGLKNAISKATKRENIAKTIDTVLSLVVLTTAISNFQNGEYGTAAVGLSFVLTKLVDWHKYGSSDGKIIFDEQMAKISKI
jgi:hypothetical protein